ncbi:hypothetical protein FT639_28640 [Bacillus mycoides]|nr:hypothetical protein [Bacillus mycoides]
MSHGFNYITIFISNKRTHAKQKKTQLFTSHSFF